MSKAPWLMISSSSAILYAVSDEHLVVFARAAALELRDAINRCS